MGVQNGAEMSAVAGFGATVRRWRRAEGWSQEELGSRAGIDQGTISAIEVGRSKPTMETVTRLARAFGRDVRDVATEAGYLDPPDGDAPRRPPELPAPLVEALEEMIRKYPGLRAQMEGRRGDPDFPGQIVDLARVLGIYIKGWIDDLERPGEGV